MRRILSLTLVAVMLLSTLMLTSCDAISNFFGGIFKKEARTEITEVEWNKTLLLDNYTVVSKGGYQDAEFMVAGDLIKIIMDAPTSNVSLSMIVDAKNGLVYSDSSLGWLALQTEIAKEDVLSLGVNSLFEDLKYEEFKYEEATKSYTAKTEDMIYDLHFEDGVLAYAMIMPISETDEVDKIEITNVGSTVVEIPKSYTNVSDGKVEPSTAGKSVRTEITASEWSSIMAANNFTVKAATFMSTIAVDVVIKQTDKGFSQVMSIVGEVLNEEIQPIIDGYLYDLEEVSSGKYEATKTSQKAKTMFAQMGLEIAFEDLVYNADGRYYRAGDAYFYFENGKLVKAVIVEGSMEVIALFSDFGTTKIDIPEYEVVSRNEVSYNEWEEIMSQRNFTYSATMIRGMTYDGEYKESVSSVFAKTTPNASMGVIANEGESYDVLIDGKWYFLELGEDGEYYAKAASEGYEGNSPIGGLLDIIGEDLEYWNFDYDEDSKAYVYEKISYPDENSVATLNVKVFFEGGEVNRIVISGERTQNEVLVAKEYYDVRISDIGATVVELPEYEMFVEAETPAE